MQVSRVPSNLILSFSSVRGNVLFILLFLSILVFISGCGVVTKGVFHPVRKGDTLWRISRAYDVPVQDIAELNNIKDPSNIRVGDNIFIPGVTDVKRVASLKTDRKRGGSSSKISSGKSRGSSGVKVSKKMAPREEARAIVMDKGRFIWPVKGKVASQFGVTKSKRNDGIDISAPPRAPIRASGEGTVVVNSNMRGYGNFLILKHKDDFYTVYAHNDKNLVKAGDFVNKGAVIANVGNSGSSNNYGLHFEIRQGKKVRNPLFFLP